MMHKEWNEEQKRTAIVSDVCDNVFVEAGAGAGKTRLVIQRVINQLKSGVLRAEQIVIITFTNKATEELYSRVEKELRRQLKEEPLAAEESANLRAALTYISDMQISTIHGFCHRILKEHAFEAGIPLDAKLLDNVEATKWQAESFDAWFVTLSEEEIIRLTDYLGNYYREDILEAYKDICDMSEEIEIPYDEALAQKPYSEFLEDVDKVKTDFGNQVVQVVNRILDASYADINQIVQTGMFNKAFATLWQKEADSKWMNDAMKCASGSMFKQRGGGISKEEALSLDEECQKVFEKKTAKDAEKLIIQYNEICYATLMHYAKKARAYYQESCGTRYLTNDQLLAKARKLVCSNADVHQALCEQFKCIYVDEFQDVDPVQVELILSIAQKEPGASALRDGVLFVVGDPKQSIYRFRGADPENYYAVKQKMAEAENANVYELDYNYRSDKKVIDWVNAYFKKIDGYRPMVYPKPGISGQGLGSSEPEKINVLSGVYRYADDMVNDGKGAVEQDAKNLSAMIQFLVQNHYCMQSEDENGTVSYRDITYGDFLILCSTTFQMGTYAQALTACGIPVQLEGKYGVEQNLVLQHFELLFRYLACPHYRKYKEGALQTIVQNLAPEGDEEMGTYCLMKHRDKTRQMNGYGIAGYLLRHMELMLPRDVILSDEEMRSCQTKLEQMVESVLSSTNGNPEEMIQAFQTYRKKKIEHELILEGSENAVRFMNVHKAKGLEGKIVVIADRSESERFKDGSVRYRREVDGKIAYSYYAFIRRKKEDGSTDFAARSYIGYSNQPDVKQYAEQEAGKEWMRLRYVTATRAEHAIIFMDPIKEGCAFSDAGLSECPSITELMQDVSVTEQSANDNDNCDVGPVKFVPQDICYESDQCTKCYDSLSPSSLEHARKAEQAADGDETETQTADGDETEMQAAGTTEENTPDGNAQVMHAENEQDVEDAKKQDKPDVSVEDEPDEPDASDEVELSDIEEELAEKRPKGSVFGTIMHRCFELLVGTFDGIHAVTEESIHRMVCLAIMENQQDMKRRYGDLYEDAVTCYQTFLKNVLGTFMANPDIRSLLTEADNIYTEYPFSFYVDPEEDAALLEAIKPWYSVDSEDTKVWINGTADLVFHMKDGMKDGRIVVVDYKSDQKKSEWSDADFEAHLRKYDGQLMLYRYAMAKLFEVPVEKVETRLYPIAYYESE